MNCIKVKITEITLTLCFWCISAYFALTLSLCFAAVFEAL